jgi:hypothetical protein
MKTFKAPWSKPLWIVSAAATLILLGVTAIPVPGMWWIRILPLAILAGALPFVVRSYTIGEGALLIRRLFWNTRIDLAGLQSARFDPAAVRGSIRTCGNGGLFSFTGWYWNSQLKSYRAFATDPKQVVVLTFDKRRVVVTPENPEEFVRELAACCQA